MTQSAGPCDFFWVSPVILKLLSMWFTVTGWPIKLWGSSCNPSCAKNEEKQGVECENCKMLCVFFPFYHDKVDCFVEYVVFSCFPCGMIFKFSRTLVNFCILHRFGVVRVQFLGAQGVKHPLLVHPFTMPVGILFPFVMLLVFSALLPITNSNMEMFKHLN